MIFTAHTVVERDDELMFYYTGYNHSHGGGGMEHNETVRKRQKELNKPLVKNLIPSGSLNLATLRLDGFVSIDALYPPGSMTTRLLTFEGERMAINADAENGYILVELTDRENKPIPGFTKEESVPFSSDDTRGEVRWNSGKRLAVLQSKPVRIIFHMKTARLYSFRFF